MEICKLSEFYKSLEKYIKYYRIPFSQENVQHIFRQNIDACKYINEQKFIHKVINFDNIIFNIESDKDKEELNMMIAKVKIIDFGFECFVNNSSLLFSALGSHNNMDPIILKKFNSHY